MRFTRSQTGTVRSVQELCDFLDYKHSVEYISMHFCFVFKSRISQYDAPWINDPGRVRLKLLELEKEHKLYCPVSILLEEVFGKKVQA